MLFPSWPEKNEIVNYCIRKESTVEKAITHAQCGACRIQGCHAGLIADVVTDKLDVRDVEVLELDGLGQVSEESVATGVAATAGSLEAAV